MFKTTLALLATIFLIACSSDESVSGPKYEVCPDLVANEEEVDQKAFEILSELNIFSIKSNKEYGVALYSMADGSIQYGEIFQGDSISVNVQATYIACKQAIAAFGHTHGAFDRNYRGEHFSVTDTLHSRVTQYLMTPLGKFLKFRVSDRKVYIFIDGEWLDY